LEETHAWGSGGGWLESNQVLSLIENCQAAIHGVVQLNPGFGVALAAWSGWDLQAMVVERDGVIVSHRAGELEAEIVGWVPLLRPGHIS
jgi:hypothetical protein